MSRRTKKQPISYEEFNSDIEIDDPVNQEINIDDVLTDDLLESSDNDRKRKTAAKKKVLTKKKAPTKRKAPASSTVRAEKTPAEKKATQTKLNLSKVTPKSKSNANTWNSERMKELSTQFPDDYWKFHADAGYHMIGSINEDNPLVSVPVTISDQAAITSMCLSPDGTLLATLCNIGSVKVFDIENNFEEIRKLRDRDEKHIDEFFCGQFVDKYLAVGGKLKDRYRWSEEDDDNHILPCPIKIFDVENCKVVARLEGHSEEILCIKALTFMGENYFVSTSQDGYIFKWHMAEDWMTLLDSAKMVDEQTCMAFNISFVPNTGNKYFVAATDEHLRLYDFEEGRLLQTFSDLYSSYCDCGKFINWLDEVEYLGKDEMDADEKSQYAWLITRGAEMCDVSEGVSSKSNTCTLHKLVYPTENGGIFKLEEIKKYQHEDYHSNSWLVKITSNGRYLLAPTIYGQIFVFNLLTGQMTAILKEHQDMEVRDVLFHPYRPLIISCGDDTCVKVYTYASYSDNKVEEDLGVGMAEVKIKDEDN